MVKIFCLLILFCMTNCINPFRFRPLYFKLSEANVAILKTNGYYYHYGNEKLKNTQVSIIFNNGIMVENNSYKGWLPQELLQKDLTDDWFTKYRKTNKNFWGIIKISRDSTFVYNYWCPYNYVGRALNFGKILNDSTYVDLKFQFEKGKYYYINDTFHFKEFSPKPDSTNNFIK